jgi:hypothetical protein
MSVYEITLGRRSAWAFQGDVRIKVIATVDMQTHLVHHMFRTRKSGPVAIITDGRGGAVLVDDAAELQKLDDAGCGITATNVDFTATRLGW